LKQCSHTSTECLLALGVYYSELRYIDNCSVFFCGLALAREALYGRHGLMPGERDIEDWVRRAIQLVEPQDRRHLDEVVPAKVRDSWLN
jgi:hypothetical protein